MKYAWLVIAMFAARFLATAIAFPAVDGDLAWQRWLGAQILRSGNIPHALGNEAFTVPGATWIPQEWAFSLFAASARGGAEWIVFAGGVACAAVLSLVIAARRAELLGASPRAIALCTACTGIALLAAFGVRAQVLAWPFVALFMLALEADGPWIYATIPLAALWSNVHASAMLAPVLAGVVLAGVAFERRRVDAATRRLVVVFVASLVAICLNPFGVELPRYALSLFASPIKAFIVEWQPTDIGIPAFAFGALPLLLVALVTFGIARLRQRDLLTFAAVAYLLLVASRNVPLFALVGSPVVALALTRVVPWFAPQPVVKTTASRRTSAVLMAYTGILFAVVVVGLLHVHERKGDGGKENALVALERAPGTHRLLCGDFAWCSLALGRLRTSVFLDGRADPYPLAVWHDYVSIVRLAPAWHELLDARDVNAVLVATGAPLDQGLANVPRWHVVYRDPNYRLWLRDDRRLFSRLHETASARSNAKRTVQRRYRPADV